MKEAQKDENALLAQLYSFYTAVEEINITADDSQVT